MKTEQLEIRLPALTCQRPPALPRRRVSRARWWFGQMRRVVDDAIEWKAPPVICPEQTHSERAPVSSIGHRTFSAGKFD